MNDQLGQLIARDTVLCSAMADEMEDYLKSNALFWEPNRRRPGGTGLPKLTFGRLLLAMRRLETLSEHLDRDQAATLQRAKQELDFQRSQWTLRYREKTSRELRSRLDAWSWYLDDIRKQGESAIVYYARQVEERVKSDLLLEEAGKVGLEVKEPQMQQAALDQRLGTIFTVGEFCWLEELAPGFPPERFWYLWGQPTNDSPP
jgi:hypothetical protein